VIYEVRLRDVSGKNIKNFVTYVIAVNDLQAIKLADDLAVELQADEIRSVVAKPKMSMKVILEAIESESKYPTPTGEKDAFEILTELFQSFKDAKTN